MLLLDTGVVIAALDRREPQYPACRELIETSVESVGILAPTICEIDHLIGRRLGPSAMPLLLRDIEKGAYKLADLTLLDFPRVRELMERYADLDVGFVDAAVLAIVERLNEPKLATLDRKRFGAMRPRHLDALELLPT